MPETTRITVKLAPKAAKNAVQGWADGPDGKWLKCMVTAPPDKGKANEALIELLASYFGMSKSAFILVRGAADRIKIIEIQGLDKSRLERG
jgi:uncharacterized protein (TIGR00251 family)